MNPIAVAAGITLLIAVAEPALAEKQDKPPARAFQKLLDCRSITDDAARLNCYDSQVNALDTAEKRKDIVIVDKEQVREARRGLFGFSLPSLKLFGDGKDEAPEDQITEIEATIAAIGRTPDGGWRFTLEDGAQWHQIDNNVVAIGPKRGTKVNIRKGAFGSYFARFNGQPGIRVKREN